MPSSRGGFNRPIRLGVFIRDYLQDLNPNGSSAIDPEKGACQRDIFHQYKQALKRAYVIREVDRENERRIAHGKLIYTEKEYQDRFDYHLARKSIKQSASRYHSFNRYFHYLKQLGWVERTGEECPSYIKQRYAEAPSRTYYRLTKEGIEASEESWNNPWAALYRH